MDLHRRWLKTWGELGFQPPARVFDELIGRYGEPQRHYHTVKHLEACLSELDAVRFVAVRPAEVELALWFHDAVYDPRREDNEARSAAWARAVMQAFDANIAERVHALVMATRHESVPDDADAALVVDIDLSILGADTERYDAYERAIREEYRWVAEPDYRNARRKILAGFLARLRIFSTEALFRRYEARARTNLARALARL